MEPEAEGLLQQEISELRSALLAEQRRRARAESKSEDLVRAVYRAMMDAAAIYGRPAPVDRPARDRRRSPEVALLHLTDWQLGKRTPSYDSDIAVARVKHAVSSALKIADVQRADHPVRECVLMLGGDLIENVNIFPGQAFEVDSGAYSQVRRAAHLLEEVVLSLLAGFEKVKVYEVWGNHGRIGKRRDEIPREDNLDRIIGGWARDTLRDQPRLTWDEPTVEWQRIVEIGDYRALLFHGDQVRGMGQTPAFAIAKRVTAWATGVVGQFHDAYMGHWHQRMQLQLPNGGMIYMTPSTESGSEFAETFVGASGQPGQRLHFVDPKRARVTAEYTLYLE